MTDITGADIIGVLLLQPEPVEGVDEDSIKADLLPDDTALPALLVRTISVRDQIELLVREPGTRQVERVSVSVRARDRDERLAIMGRVTRRCAGFVGDVLVGETIVSGVSIHDAGRGPGLIGPGTTFEQAADFRVSFPTA